MPHILILISENPHKILTPPHSPATSPLINIASNIYTYFHFYPINGMYY